MENSQNKKPNKYVVLATYLVAVVCLLLGLFLPLWGDKGILALQLPDVLNKIAGKDVISSVKNEFALSYPVDFLGSGKAVDVMAWIALLYVVVTAFSLIAVIPIALGTKKNNNKLVSVFAYITEIAAVIVTSLYVIIALRHQYITDSIPAEYLPAVSKFAYNMAIALGGSLIALIVLSILNKKGGGALKTLLFLLSAVALIALYDLSAFIPKLAELPIAPALFGNELLGGRGIDYLALAFEGGLKDLLAFMPETKDKAAMMLCIIVGIVVLLNYFVDVIGLSTNAKKTGYWFNAVRYGLEILAIICLFITVAVCKYKIGLMLIALAVAALIQTLISVLRLLLFIKNSKKAKNEVTKVEYTKPEEQKPEPIIVEPEKPEPKPYQQPPEPVLMEEENIQPKPDKYGFNEPAVEEPVQMQFADIEPEPVRPVYEQRPVQPQPVPVHNTPVQSNYNVYGSTQQAQVYTINTIYGGPVDEFMKKLTNEERIEFAMTFIEKSKGNIGNIPEYVIGGNNRLFFSSVFIYLGRIRGLISDGLLNKMYMELNIL